MKNIVKTVLLSVILTAFTGTIAQDTIVCKGSGIIRPSKILPPASFLYRNLIESSTLDINVIYDYCSDLQMNLVLVSVFMGI